MTAGVSGTPGSPELSRALGLRDATVIGVASMVGAGVFAAFAPAARAAGDGLLIGLAIAAVIAFANATSSAQLAAQYPRSGGTYLYGREQLGAWWGFLAGWGFVIGKTASCAAMALTFSAYVAPEGWERIVAALAVAALAGVNLFGVTRTAGLASIIVTVVLLVLAIVVASGVAGALPGGGLLDPSGLVAEGWYGILQSGGLLFFAFAGYARMATMGEEVREPARTIPRAIVLALAVAVVVYAAVGVTALASLGAEALGASAAPLVDVVRANDWAWAAPLVRVGGAAASLGALLALIAGIGRTSLAMARERDLPSPLARVGSRFRVPWVAEGSVAVVVIVLVLTVDLRGAIGFSSFGVLLYYLVANLAAFTQGRDDRRYPRWLQMLGAVGCLVLVATLPWTSVVAGVVVFAVGVVGRLVVLAARGRR